MSVQCLYVDSEYQVDSVDVTISGNIVCALSRTEGNGKNMVIRLSTHSMQVLC